ncbi:MAG TPA: ABC transporter permease [Candidatus Sulfopaludibacter sp.]|nr:ABC transporter permease [Candidatus Sulfopaludibacter sp.]
MKFWNRFRLRTRGGRLETELNDEIRLHRELLQEEFVRGGMSPQEAAREAARQFGNSSEASDLSRDVWTFPRFDAIAKDVRFALRLMLRHPLLTAAAVLTVAFGVGANTAILSILETVLLNPLGMRHTERVMAARVHIDRLHMKDAPNSAADFQDVQGLTDIFSTTAATEGRVWTYQAGPEAVRMLGRAVTPEFFSVFDSSPAAGRFFTANDADAVVLSYAMWQSQFGGDAGVVGRSVTLDGKPYRVIGVASRGFRYPADAAAYTLLTIEPQRIAQGHGNNMNLTVLARLRANVTPQQASRRVRLFSAAQQTADTTEGRDSAKFGYGLDLTPFAAFVAGDLRSPLWLLWTAALVVLATGCANVAGLLLTRSSGRRKEIAIRLSVGATRWLIVRQLLLESLLMGAAGGLAGIAMARVGVSLVTRLSIPGKQVLELVVLDNRMLLYGLGLALASSLLFGLAPAVQLLRDSQAGEMVRSRRRWFQDIFVVAEVAGAFLLLVMTGLLLRSLWTVQQIQPGFDAHHVTTAYFTKPKNDPGFQQRLKAALQNGPGVESAALAYPVPFTQGGLTSGFQIRNRQPAPGEPAWHGEAYFVTPEYFHTLRIPILAGRNLSDTDTEGAPIVCLIDRKLADRFFPNQNPIGQELAMYKGYARIVGVTAAVLADGLEEETRPVVYYSLPQIPFFQTAAVLVRSAAPAGNLIRETLRNTNSSVPVYDVLTMDELIDEKLGIRRVLAVLLTIFGGISLLLATIGIYGVIAQVVAERTQEIGVRIALGARPGQILRQFLAHGIRSAALGLAVGGAAMLFIQKWISGLLYEVKPFDWLTVVAALVAVLIVLMVAIWWPARRASRVDPLTALRYE